MLLVFFFFSLERVNF